MQILIDRLIDELFWDLAATLSTFHLQRVAQLAISLEPEPEPEPAPEAALELDSDCPAIIQMKCRRWLWILLQILSMLSTTCTNYVVRLPRTGQAQLLPTHTHTHTVARVLDGLIELINDVAHCALRDKFVSKSNVPHGRCMGHAGICLGCGTAWWLVLLVYGADLPRHLCPTAVHH